MTAQDFFKKNLRYITIGLFVIFMLKSFQSCNRNMEVKKLTKENTYLVDSLNTMYGTEKATLLFQLEDCNDARKQLEYEVKLANAGKVSANRRADAVQSTAEKVRDNTTTTIKIENKRKTRNNSEIIC